jgi:hypothetical protein
MDEMAEILSQINPKVTKYWSDRIAEASTEKLNIICNNFPKDWASPARVEFAEVFINPNSSRLQGIIELTNPLLEG